MAATPPRPVSPQRPRAVALPKPGHNLQISPNLEALLQHDELTRRNSGSPTNYSSPSSEFAISLPPPPPRRSNGGRKAGQREQEPFPTTRSKEGQRAKCAAGTFSPDGGASAPGQSTSGPSSRPATPNPYLNPAPVVDPINSPDLALLDEAPTPKQAERVLPIEPKPEPSRSTAGTETPRGRTSASDHRALHKVLWMGRDSLNLFSGSAHSAKRDADRRNERTEPADFDAVQDRQLRHVPVAPTQSVSRPSSRFGDRDTATVSSSSMPGTSHPHALQRDLYGEPCEAISHPTRFESDFASDPSRGPPPAAHLLPRLSLPSIMSDSSSQRPRSVDEVTGDYLSFIDFFSPSAFDEPNLYNAQGDAQEGSASRHHLPPISIPSPTIYSLPRHDNLSSGSLSSMKFAPPSPTSLIVQQPSPASVTSSSPVALSTMIFALPSPSNERPPSRLQPLSDPPSPYSPVEFAVPPISPHEVLDEPSLPTVLGLAGERGRKLKSKKRSKSTSPYHVHALASPLPPTTNQLDANERADRIRRNRKLARVFGMTPGVEEGVPDCEEPRISKKLHSPALAALLTKQKNHRHAVSVSVSVKASGTKTEPSTPWQAQELYAPDGRRHSTPLATNFTLYVDNQKKRTPGKASRRSRKPVESPNADAASTRSFIDLSEEDVQDDVSELSCFTMHQQKLHRLHHSTSTPSLVESLDPEAQAELERRRKREKLARLHRFLGSQVPLEAVTGSLFGPPLPPPAPIEEPSREHRKNYAIRDDFDRVKEELDEREKALNVRRAQKMERVFGTTPPQMLFHTRPSRPNPPISLPTSPADPNPFVLTLDLPSTSRNPNRTAYLGKTIPRPGPSDSSRCLLSGKEEDTPQSSPSSAQSFTDSFAESPGGYQRVLAQSTVYLNYQHSLNSLVDIIDRDDRQSLLQLHRFLHREADDSPTNEEAPVNPRRFSNASSLKSERRHSLPSNASMTSLSSASPQTSRFQIRRRKAAKLTNFFGVDYKELIHDILESIEKGVEEESNQGTLQPQETEVLMHRVRSLRTMKDPFGSS